MNRPHDRWAVILTVVMVISVSACRSVPQDPTTACALPVWAVDGAEFKEWSVTDPDFTQDRALEGSGMVASDFTLYITSEKYHRLLRIDAKSLDAEVLDLAVPKHSELEGVTLLDGKALLCDEAHAAVLAVDIDSVSSHGRHGAVELGLHGIEVAGGKVGLEGITAVNDGSHRVFLLLERSGNESEGCTSTVFPMRRSEDHLEVAGTPLYVALEDCNWRLTALQWWKGSLFALKTRYPGTRYEVVVVDTVTGELTKVLELTDILNGVRREGWGNNVEGLTITPDGALWLLSDNAVTGVIDDDTPPVAQDKTLLMRIPAVEFECID